MSNSNKLIIALVLVILLVGGWFITKKPVDTNEAAQQTAEEATDLDNEAAESDIVVDLETAVEKGTVTIIPVNPQLGERGVGDSNAPIQIREYYSLTCSHCADFHKGTFQELKTKYIDTGKIYFIHEEFPLNGPALYGSMIARCLPEERYNSFIDLLLRTQDAWAFGGDFKGNLMQDAKLAGMSEEEFETCYNDKDLQKALANNISAATDAWNVTSTPSFVVNNGQFIIRGNKSIAVFDALVNELSAGEPMSNEMPRVIEPMGEHEEVMEPAEMGFELEVAPESDLEEPASETMPAEEPFQAPAE